MPAVTGDPACLIAREGAVLGDEIGPKAIIASIQSAAVCGTPGTMALSNTDLIPVTDTLIYNLNGFDAKAAIIAQHAPGGHIVLGRASALGRALRLQSQDAGHNAKHLGPQADFILAQLTGQRAHSGENNHLKISFDMIARQRLILHPIEVSLNAEGPVGLAMLCTSRDIP
jgi:hypothetical protein